MSSEEFQRGRCSSKHPQHGQCILQADHVRMPGLAERQHLAYITRCGDEPETWVDGELIVGSLEQADRVRPGLYRHYAPNSPPYVVIAVSIMDVHGHGNLDAPRIVTYHSTRSFVTGIANSHTEEDFTRPTVWPDGVTRPRFVRIDP